MAPVSAEQMMRRAIELSRRGFPAPNPHVGCVIALGDQVVGEGWHDHAGGPHAEIVALKDAGERARGATAFVTLEPCNHHGRTPPCANALLEAGIAEVVIACPDPNPRAVGGGSHLESQGVRVQWNCLTQQAADVNRMFLHAFRIRRPYVALKVASTEDGFLARPDGSSKWITGQAAREVGHRLRAELGAVMVGRATVEIDRPLLTARIPGVVNQPQAIVIDPTRRLSATEGLMAHAWRIVRGAPQSEYEISLGSPPSMFTALDEIFRRGCIGVLVEGGAETARRCLEEGWADEVHEFRAPIQFGEGRMWEPARNWRSEMRLIDERTVGNDLYRVWRRENQ